jgi:phenylalanyl-tRNA synthetase beta chain
MNILIPHNWLLDHLETDAAPKDIQHALSLCGPSVERVYDREGDSVYDIEVTTNRVDSASVRGIAREAATILPELGFKAKLKNMDLPKISSDNPSLDIKIVNDPTLCHRILAVKLINVTVNSSPAWLQKRLIQVEQRPLNNVVDITNYVMWDLGHPVHVFDYDKFTQKKLIVREAKKNEVIHTLDDKKHTTIGGEVIFEDGSGKIIDMPGIMGTHNTAVDNNTRNILFFIDSVKAEKIRFASMSHNIRSQAAVLNEKGVDPNLGTDSMLSGINLYQSITHAQIGSNIKDIYPNPILPSTTILLQNQIDTHLGLKIGKKRIITILESLGCIVSSNNQSYSITPPSFRTHDLNIPEDYIEEIARIYGYHNLPSVIMPTAIPIHQTSENFDLEHQIKLWLACWGCQEVYTYSMVSKELAQQTELPLKDHLAIANPLSDDWVYMRRSLVPSLNQVLKTNPSQDRIIFEMQNVYHPNPGKLPTEELHLTLLTNNDYPVFKGIIDALIKKLFILDYRVTKTGEISINGKVIGQISKIDQGFVADFLAKALIAAAKTHPSTLALSPYPPIIEDLTFTLPAKTAVGPIIDSIANSHTLITKVDLKGIYNQNYTFTITYQSDQKNLATEDIAPIRKQIVTTLEKEHIPLVGKI